MADSGASREEHWARTSRLTVITLILWFIFSFGVHWFAPDLNKIVILGFPLGYYMAAQGSLIVFVILCFWFSSQQDKIDRECGMAED